jgi:hypothetical protein
LAGLECVLGDVTGGNGFDKFKGDGTGLYVFIADGVAIHSGVVPMREVEICGDELGQDTAPALAEGDGFDIRGCEDWGVAEDELISGLRG